MAYVLPVILALIVVVGFPALILRYSSANKRKFAISLYVMVCVFLMRFFVGMFGSWGEDHDDLPFLDEVLNSIVHAFQTFSMDEDYTSYINAGRTALIEGGLVALGEVYGFVAAIFNLAAPILGGALLLDILTDLFPNLAVYMRPFCQKFIFSELNEGTISLAEDLCARDESGRRNYTKIIGSRFFWDKPMFVFTDVDGEVSELTERVREIGGVTLKTGVLSCHLRMSKSVHYILADEDTGNNIAVLSGLMNSSGRSRTMPEPDKGEPVVKIFVFVETASDAALVRNICAESLNSDKAVVRTIRSNMHAAVNLMYDVPLFLPLISEEDHSELNIAILGAGSVAEEALKAIYWCGQMNGVKLNVTVMAQDASSLEARLRHSHSELMRTCDKDSDILEVYPTAPGKLKNPPYINSLVFTDIEDVQVLTDFPEGLLAKTHYYIVALGEDHLDIEVSDLIRHELKVRALTGDCPVHPVIVPAVFNPALSKAVDVVSPGEGEPYVIPYATLDELFSCKNVFMVDFTASALSSADLYDRNHQEKLKADEYRDWANIAKTVHAPYKAFSLGLVTEGTGSPVGKAEFAVKTHPELTDEQLDRLAWLEHRRWNAFLRAQGYSCPTREQLDSYFKATGEHKQVALRLHPCLVEDLPHISVMPKKADFPRDEYDALDYVSMYVYKLKKDRKGEPLSFDDLPGSEYKQWDYARYDDAFKRLVKYE